MMNKKKRLLLLLIVFIILAVSLLVFYIIFTPKTPPEPAPPEPTEVPAPTVSETARPTEEPAKTTEPVETPTFAPEPTPKAINSDILLLREEYGNDDIIGRLYIEGTSIDYPVTQYEDNEFYLDYDINKKTNVTGWIFLDYENDVYKDDKNMVIYGHNMKQDIMFHALRNYADEDFYDKHKYIVFDTLYDKYTWEIFSFYRAHTDFYYIQVIFKDEEDFYSLASQMKDLSIYETGVGITRDDRILTLSTCTNETDDTRFVLNAKLIENPTEN